MEGGNGLRFYNDAEKAINQKSIFSMFGGSNSKYETAADLYKNAGNAYKMDNAWQSAGVSFTKAAEACLKGDNKNDAINHYVEAANCFKRISPVDAINTFMIAINMYIEGGRFGMCARYWKEIAEIYEGDHNETDAMAAYTKAADFFGKDNKAVNANQCLLKVATFGAEKGELIKAAEIFEKIATESLSSKLGAFSAKGYFFQALQCLLATGDYVNVNRKLESFKNADFSFGNCRECQFAEKLLKACEELDSEAFADACSDFDRITPLNPWQTSMLLKAKKHVADNSGEEVDLA